MDRPVQHGFLTFTRRARRSLHHRSRISRADVTKRFRTASPPRYLPYPAPPSLASMPTLPDLPSTPLGLYRHYKGGEYEVIGVARHSETHRALVVYRPLYNATGWWVRPHAMFFGTVNVEGTAQPALGKSVEIPVGVGPEPSETHSARPRHTGTLSQTYQSRRRYGRAVPVGLSASHAISCAGVGRPQGAASPHDVAQRGTVEGQQQPL